MLPCTYLLSDPGNDGEVLREERSEDPNDPTSFDLQRIVDTLQPSVLHHHGGHDILNILYNDKYI